MIIVKLRKVGGSCMLRIPKQCAKLLEFRANDEFELEFINKKNINLKLRR